MTTYNLDKFARDLDNAASSVEKLNVYFGGNFLYRLHTRLFPVYGYKSLNLARKKAGKWFSERNSGLPTPYLNSSALASLASLIPSAVPVSELAYRKRIQLFTMEDTFAYLSQPHNSKHIFTAIVNHRDFWSELVDPQFAMALALAITVHYGPDERRQLARLDEALPSGAQEWELVHKAIQARLQALEGDRPIPTEDVFKPVILLVGQLRSVEESIPQLESFFNGTKPDVYISSWDTVGYPLIEKHRLNRLLTPEGLEWLKARNYEGWDGLVHAIKRTRVGRGGAERLLRDCLKGGQVKGINLEDEQRQIFRRMSNPEKMYYHSSYWIEELGAEFFRQNYTHVIKLRPDLNLGEAQLNIDKIRNVPSNAIASEMNNWVYERWGFGAGDQALVGTVDSMVRILDIRPQSDDLAYEIFRRLFAYRNLLEGHVNIALKMWVEGMVPAALPWVHQGFNAGRLLTLDEVKLATTSSESE